VTIVEWVLMIFGAVTVFDHDPLDGVDASEEVTGSVGVVGEQGLPDRLQLEQDLLEPQLVRLVHHDEQQLIVGRRVGQQGLKLQQFGDPQVRGVGELAPLLAEAG